MALHPSYTIPSTDSRDVADPQPVTGSVTVEGNVTADVEFPTSFAVSNFPAVQPVSGVVFPAVQPVSGTVTVANPTPATNVSALALDATVRPGTTLTPNQFNVSAAGTTIPAVTGAKAVAVMAHPDNSENIELTAPTGAYGTGWTLPPGASVDVDVSALSSVRLIAASTTQRACTLKLA